MTEHSTPPWKVVTDGFKDGFTSIETEDGGYEVVMSCRHDNAAHIVKCVNAHEKLVEALREALKYLPTITSDGHVTDNGIRAQVKEALKLAEVE